MKSSALLLFSIVFSSALITGCKKSSDGLKGEVWPKSGYLLTTNSDRDTVYVEAANYAETQIYSARFPLDDPEKRWTITLPSSGDGVLIHTEQGEYWTIDSVFHPGANVEQHVISMRSTTEPDKLSDFSRFKYHKAGDDGSFYIESVVYPDYYVTGMGHAGSGRGLTLKNQNNGIWEFWLQQN